MHQHGVVLGVGRVGDPGQDVIGLRLGERPDTGQVLLTHPLERLESQSARLRLLFLAHAAVRLADDFRRRLRRTQVIAQDGEVSGYRGQRHQEGGQIGGVHDLVQEPVVFRDGLVPVPPVEVVDGALLAGLDCFGGGVGHGGSPW